MRKLAPCLSVRVARGRRAGVRFLPSQIVSDSLLIGIPGDTDSASTDYRVYRGTPDAALYVGYICDAVRDGFADYERSSRFEAFDRAGRFIGAAADVIAAAELLNRGSNCAT